MFIPKASAPLTWKQFLKVALCSPVISVALVSPSFGQGVESLSPEDFALLKKAHEVDEIKEPVSKWLQNRRDVTEIFMGRLESAKLVENDKPVLYGSLLARQFSGADVAERRMLETEPANFSQVLLRLKPQSRGRVDVVDAMQLVAKLDIQLVDATKSETTKSMMPAIATWSYYRATFALNFASLSKLFKATPNNPLTIPIEVRTVNPFTHAQQKGYEVMRVLVFWKGDQNREATFPGFSSPVQDTVDAGNYYIWCRRQKGSNYIEGPIRSFTLNAVQKQPLEISIPAEDMHP